MFQLGGRYWKTWNREVRKALLSSQRGKEDGCYNSLEQEEPSSIEACYAGSIQGRVALGSNAGAYLERIGRDPNARPDFEPGALLFQP